MTSHTTTFSPMKYTRCLQVWPASSFHKAFCSAFMFAISSRRCSPLILSSSSCPFNAFLALAHLALCNACIWASGRPFQYSLVVAQTSTSVHICICTIQRSNCAPRRRLHMMQPPCHIPHCHIHRNICM